MLGKEIFLRELISNASDALDKLNMLVLTDEKYKEVKLDPCVEILTYAKINKSINMCFCMYLIFETANTEAVSTTEAGHVRTCIKNAQAS